MSWHYSQALVAAYSAANSSGGAPSAPSKSNPTPQAYLSPDRMKAFSRLSRFGMTYAPLTGSLGVDVLTWFLAGFRVRTYPTQAEAQELMGPGVGCGQSTNGSLARFDPDSCSLKTHQHSLLGGGFESLQTLPRWGTIADGELYPRHTAEPAISGNACGFWHPTPTKDDFKGASPGALEKKGESYLKYWLHVRFPSPSTTYPAPEFMECVMGWPTGWTELKPLGTDRFRQWLRSHGIFFQL